MRLEPFGVEAALIHLRYICRWRRYAFWYSPTVMGSDAHLDQGRAAARLSMPMPVKAGMYSDDEGGDHHPQEDIEPPLWRRMKPRAMLSRLRLSLGGAKRRFYAAAETAANRKTKERLVCGLSPTCDYNAEHSKSLGRRVLGNAGRA